MTYTELEKKAEERISSVPIVWGFSDEQIREGAKKLGFEVTELKAIGAGGYMRPQDKHLLDKAYDDSYAERQEWMKDLKNLQYAFEYELANHEYCITYDDAETWRAVGISMKDSTKEQREAFVRARELYLAAVEY
jgi:hypothetical protein